MAFNTARGGILGVLVAAGALCAPAPGFTQELVELRNDLPVTLVADEVTYDSVGRKLTASGSVEVFYGDRTLTAERIVYDQATDQITATGQIVVRNPDGSTLYADYAELDRDLQNGLLQSARSVLAQRFRIAAVEGQRVGGRYNVLGKAVFSNCEVCAEYPEPWWRIRARRVVHDQLEKKIHYEDATFDLLGVPVMYLPYFSHPDPTVERMSGFLMPDFRQSDTFGYGAKLPYYWVIDEQSDATITPFITTDEGLLLEGEYRRRFENGRLRLGGVATYDNSLDTVARPLRGTFNGDGYYYLSDTIFGHFDSRLVTDDGFLSDFEYSEDDRLTSEAAISSFRRDGYWEIGTAYFQSLRDDEGKGSIPFALPEFDLQQVWQPTFGGDLGITLNSVGLKRSEGQDTFRATAIVDYEKTWITASGVTLRGFGSAQFDAFRTWDSDEVPNEYKPRFTPELGVDMRYPLIQSTENATHVLEPIAQLIWSEPSTTQSLLPNEDSALVEFDETNLFDTSRFAGYDRVEPGFRANLGVRYERFDADGWSIGTVVGRVLRNEPQDVFDDVPGLDGRASDYVGAVTFKLPPYLSLVNRVLLREDMEFDRYEVRLDSAYGPLTLAGSYVYLTPDPQAQAFDERSEGAVDASYVIDSNWSVSGRMRYDFQEESFVRAGAGITYGNECFEIDFSVYRRFTSSETVDASTSFGVQVRLAGLGSDLTRARRADRCRLITR
ncbi:LPS-assembly protein LptD [Oceanicella sp. SM1341]|uniref:LPS-assembly protein LptD n=1 Tax=Oceanicella sp. SM1341 TaxID=1548889 RepID=UPI00130053D6|nr:LPS assembly protein LptD [Oceanicella sp. SM1341]